MAPAKKEQRRGVGWQVFFSFVLTLFIIYMLLGRLFSVNFVSESSMYPTLHDNDIVVSVRNYYANHDLQRGDVIIYPYQGYYVIKRVVGIEDDFIRIRDGRVFVNDELLDEPYLDESIITDGNAEFTVPDGMCFTMGDNRDASYDSRHYADPYVDKDIVLGRACAVMHGFHFELLPRYTFTTAADD